MQTSSDDIILTDHARERMQLRRISPVMIAQTIRQPDRTEREDDGDTKFTKSIDGRQVQVIGRWESDESKWLVKSTWVRGEDDPKPTLLGQLLSLAIKALRAWLGGQRR
jgi:hypothetical protein